MSEHTPGPWAYQNDAITSAYGDIARVHFQSSRDRRGWDDRRLIAAAPELLAACKAALHQMENGTGANDLRSLFRSAIDKAEGRGE